ncbi:zinc-dependent alcohol dehydrogenase family protein [Cohnella terricola]|uniref:Zinc-dependent alcohol dehydrogenase family protein n=1 Tax=Cohnella terricola TaxID=1289167 RepID=A0A559JT22_9BACL|nr:zinc-dependent alcohol dehydrogenase family protein [Cohnella terricola]TVY03021.1 zinc-dependent alcohol dehydrogenase family protein [Cohnella terricola]
MPAQAIKYYRFGNPLDVLSVENVPRGSPGQGEVMVRMTARPINPSDLIPIRGAYAHRISLPSVPGYEGVGIVVDAGPGVSREWIGRRVLPLRGEGTWQEYVISPAKWLVRVPSSLEDGIAAQLYINPITAWLACTEKLELQAGDTLVVNACGSSLGRLIAQLSRIAGYRLIAVTGNADNERELLRLGAAHVIHSANVSVRHTVMELTQGRGADAAIDSIGGAPGTELAFCLKPYETLLGIGLLSGRPLDGEAIRSGTSTLYKMFHLRLWNGEATERSWHDTFDHVLEMIAGGRLTLMDSVIRYPLAEFRHAVGIAETPGRAAGKVLLTD